MRIQVKQGLKYVCGLWQSCISEFSNSYLYGGGKGPVRVG